jgi:hypothetical protein
VLVVYYAGFEVSIFGRLAAIGATVLGVAVVFAYTGGWLRTVSLPTG